MMELITRQVSYILLCTYLWVRETIHRHHRYICILIDIINSANRSCRYNEQVHMRFPIMILHKLLSVPEKMASKSGVNAMLANERIMKNLLCTSPNARSNNLESHHLILKYMVNLEIIG